MSWWPRSSAMSGEVSRFGSADRFAGYTRTAPIEVLSGAATRPRLSRSNGSLNDALHLSSASWRRSSTAISWPIASVVPLPLERTPPPGVASVRRLLRTSTHRDRRPACPGVAVNNVPGHRTWRITRFMAGTRCSRSRFRAVGRRYTHEPRSTTRANSPRPASRRLKRAA
jgi:hypothetical protein